MSWRQVCWHLLEGMGIYPSASIEASWCGHVRFDVVRTYFNFRVRVSGFRIFIGIFSSIVFSASNSRCLSQVKHRKRIRRTSDYVEAGWKQSWYYRHWIKGTVETELFFIYPVRNTRWEPYFACRSVTLTFAVAVEQFYEKYIIVTYESDIVPSGEKDGTCWSAVGQSRSIMLFVVTPLSFLFQRVYIMHSCMGMPINRERFV